MKPKKWLAIFLSLAMLLSMSMVPALAAGESAASLASAAVAYNPGGTAFDVTVPNTDYTDLTITYSMGKYSGTLEKNTDYSVTWNERESKATVTILSTSSYNTLGQNLIVSYAGTELGTISIQSTASVTLVNNALTLTGGNGETLSDYLGQITQITINETEYPTVSQRNVTDPYDVSDFFTAEGLISFNPTYFADGQNGSYSITITASGFDSVTGTAGTRDGNGGHDNAPSSLSITVPTGLADGNYTATAKVEPDDDEGFHFYYITVTVTVKDGAIAGISVSGATSSNTQYSYRAETGISDQVSGKTAGTYDVDAISMATCSSNSIIEAISEALQGELANNTTLTLSDATYDAEGTPFTVTVTDPEAGVDYSDITLAYALGKFADSLTKDTDYTVELVSENDSELVYRITVQNSTYEIVDDTANGTSNYNSLGRNLDVTVAGSSAGRVVIMSGAAVAIQNNQLTLTGGNGETLTDYIASIGNVTVSYTDENGEAVEATYTTQLAHDVYPDYYGSDFFHENGAVNFDIAPFVNGVEGAYTITVEAGGFDNVTGKVGAASSEREDPVEDVQFTDVSAGAYYYDAVAWAVANGITNGYGGTAAFAPDVTCSRAEAMTFLWRAAGQPEPAASENPFTDVSESSYYYKAVLWAVENGITNGHGSAAAFAPDATCSRAEIVTFLYRAAGSSSTSAGSSFDDVSGSAYYANAVAWAVENAVTNGHGNTAAFAPDATCSRAEIVTFLSRAYAG